MPTRNYQTAAETIRRYSEATQTLEATDHLERKPISDPEALAELITPLLQDADREHCLTITLDTKNRPIRIHLTSTGAAANTFMAPREIFRDAFSDAATSIMLAHNHPSGDPEPSRDDERITKRLSEAGRILGIEVIDHLVIGHNGRWVSMARRGCI